MKRFMFITLLASFGLLLAQDAAGTYKLTGTNVRYTNLARQTTVASVSDSYGFGVNTPVSVIANGSGFFQLLNGPFNEDNLELGGAFLNVTFNEDGTGTINEGSYYPTTELDEETCTTAGTVLPITDELVYTSNLAPVNYVQNVNIIGLPSLSPFAAANGGSGAAGGISLSQSEELDFFTFGQSAGALGACLAGYYYDGSPCDASFPGNDCDIYEACASAGYVSKGHDIETIQDNGVRDMYVEWHAIDGALSQSGYGDDLLDPCEDDLCVANANQAQCFELDPETGGIIPSPACTAEGEAIDNIFGIPYMPSTAMNPECGYNADILGDAASVSAGLAGGVQSACEGGMQGDADGNGYPDVVDGCFALEQGYGLPGDQAATMAFVAACEQLGFSTEDCEYLASIAQGAVEATTICYNVETHDFYPADSAEECADGYFFTNAAWDCYGLLMLTFDAGAVCSLAADAYVSNCVDGDSVNRNFYLMDAGFTPWGGFFTWNALQYSQTGDPSFLVSDGTFDFDPYCLADGNPSDCAGRLLMVMDPLCVPTTQIREVYIDFDEIDDCAHNGDVNLDDIVNILDVVNLVQAILGLEDLSDNQVCNADINSDDIINILDVVAIVQAILGNSGRDATEIEILNNNNSVTFESNGYVGAVQMTLSHGDDFEIELTDGIVSLYNTTGNTTELMIVNPEGKELFTTVGDFEIIKTEAVNSNEYIDIINPEAISLSSAYPNPFNPTTSFELTVGNAGHVTMNVYNVMGQTVETLVNNSMEAGKYDITWEASNFPSGAYMIRAEANGQVSSQKVMLVK
jgi:hypothetical protein